MLVHHRLPRARESPIDLLQFTMRPSPALTKKALGLKLWTPVSAVMPCSSDPLRLRHIILRFG